MNSDAQLLQAYAVGSEPAFTELVSRYTDLVYSAALRQVGEPELARDVTQQVFIDLARKAGRLNVRMVLAGWLFRATQFATLNTLRRERRYKARGQEAMSHWQAEPDPVTGWDHIGPVLDEAVNALSAKDREAVLLRFFKNEDLREIGQRLGISEKAAQKRVSRALDKLRVLLIRRGVNTSAALLSGALSANAVQSAPLGLAATLASTSYASAGATGSITTFNLLNLMASTKVKAVVMTFTLAATVVTPLLLQQHAMRKLRAENLALRGQTAQLSESRRAEHSRPPATQVEADELQRLRERQNEMLGLGGQIGEPANPLRLVTNSADRVGDQAASSSPLTNPPPLASAVGWGELAHVKEFSDRGQHSPETALETLIWAAQNQPERIAELVQMPETIRQSPEKLESVVKDLGQQLNAVEQGVVFMRLQNLQYWGAYGVGNEDGTSTIYKDVVQLQYSLGWAWAKERPEAGVAFPNQLKLTRVAGKWKLLFEHWSPSNLPLAEGGPSVR